MQRSVVCFCCHGTHGTCEASKATSTVVLLLLGNQGDDTLVFCGSMLVPGFVGDNRRFIFFGSISLLLGLIFCPLVII